jgi:hypothetical protein
VEVQLYPVASSEEAFHGQGVECIRLAAGLHVTEAAAELGITPEALEALEGGRARLQDVDVLWAVVVALWRARRCRVEGCRKKVKARGVCMTHYQQNRRDGA